MSVLPTGQGSGLDYTVGNTVVSALFQQSTAHEVVVTFLVDGVALEADENFVLELILLPEIIPPMGEGVFFINRITMTILDSDSKSYTYAAEHIIKCTLIIGLHDCS